MHACEADEHYRVSRSGAANRIEQMVDQARPGLDSPCGHVRVACWLCGKLKGSHQRLHGLVTIRRLTACTDRRGLWHHLIVLR
jgi:hypothetical protein